MIPKYAFEVERIIATGNVAANNRQPGQDWVKRPQDRTVKAFETLQAAMGYRDAVLRVPNTMRVTVRMVIDDWQPGTAQVGEHDNQSYRHQTSRNGQRPIQR